MASIELKVSIKDVEPVKGILELVVELLSNWDALKDEGTTDEYMHEGMEKVDGVAEKIKDQIELIKNA